MTEKEEAFFDAPAYHQDEDKKGPPWKTALLLKLRSPSDLLLTGRI
jgi:hypothetical protein